MTFASTVFNFVLSTMSQAGYAGVFALIALESATLPVPSEVVLPFAGYLVYLGRFNFWLVVVAATAGSLIGTLIDFEIGYRLGRPAVLRFGRYIRINEGHLLASESWFERRGPVVVLLARFVPLVRTLVAFPAGVGKMSLTKFLLYSLVGIFAWNILLIYVGLYFGRESTGIIGSLYSAFSYADIAIIGLVVVSLLLFVVAKRRKIKKGKEDTIEDRAGDH